MKYFALWLESPIQSWGVDSRFSLRSTFSFPTKSGIAGIILSSLGRGGEEREFLRIFSALKETAVSFKAGSKNAGPSKMIDFQVIGNGYDENDDWALGMIPKKRDGGKAVGGGAKLTYRHYLQNAFFGVVQEIDDSISTEVAEGLQNPHWPIYLGRRCCIPSYPVYNGTFESESEAMDKLFQIAGERGLVESERLVEGYAEEAFDSFYLMDVPVAFGIRKEYSDRLVSIIRKTDG